MDSSFWKHAAVSISSVALTLGVGVLVERGAFEGPAANAQDVPAVPGTATPPVVRQSPARIVTAETDPEQMFARRVASRSGELVQGPAVVTSLRGYDIDSLVCSGVMGPGGSSDRYYCTLRSFVYLTRGTCVETPQPNHGSTPPRAPLPDDAAILYNVTVSLGPGASDPSNTWQLSNAAFYVPSGHRLCAYGDPQQQFTEPSRERGTRTVWNRTSYRNWAVTGWRPYTQQ